MFSALLFAVTAFGANLQDYTFNDFVKEYNKVYVNDADRVIREGLFLQRKLEVVRHNAQGLPYTKGINHMADWTDEEFKGLLGYHSGMGAARRANLPKKGIFEDSASLQALPLSVDWRRQNAVSPVKNQGHCGSCWTFAAAETVESHWYLATGIMQELSEQQMASCTSNPLNCGGTGGCEGGIAQVAWESIMTNDGLATEWTYPYVSYQGTDYQCAYNASTMVVGAKLAGLYDVPQNSYVGLMNAVALSGPVSISVDASTWHLYSGGVWAGCNMTSPDINHAVQLVGYGTDVSGGDYWLVRNSWGPLWGEDGYIRVQRQTGSQICATDITPQDGSGCDGGPTTITVCGMCGILYDNTFPLVDTK